MVRQFAVDEPKHESGEVSTPLLENGNSFLQLFARPPSRVLSS